MTDKVQEIMALVSSYLHTGLLSDRDAIEAALRVVAPPVPEPTPPHEWDEYALKEAQRLWALPEMPKGQLVACLQVALVDAMHFAGRADHALEAAAKVLDANEERCEALSYGAMLLESNAKAIRAMKGKP